MKIASIKLLFESLIKRINMVIPEKVYEIVEANAAPLIPQRGINIIFKITLIQAVIIEMMATDPGLPLPAISLVNIFVIDKTAIPGSKINRGVKAAIKLLPYSSLINIRANRAMKNAISIVMKKLTRQILEDN